MALCKVNFCNTAFDFSISDAKRCVLSSNYHLEDKPVMWWSIGRLEAEQPIMEIA